MLLIEQKEAHEVLGISKRYFELWKDLHWIISFHRGTQRMENFRRQGIKFHFDASVVALLFLTTST